MKASLWTIFISFLKIGAFTFGGGYAMIPLIAAEMIERRKWLTSEEFLGQLAQARTDLAHMRNDHSFIYANLF